jgi:hypothetical protein
MKLTFIICLGAALVFGCTTPRTEVAIETVKPGPVCVDAGMTYSLGAVHNGLRCDFDPRSTTIYPESVKGTPFWQPIRNPK